MHHSTFVSFSFLFFFFLKKKKSNSPNFVEISPEFHLGGIGTHLGQIPAEEHLTALDLGAVFVQVLFDRSLIGSVSRVEGAGGDVGFEEFLVDDIDDGGDESFDVLGTGGEGLDVIWIL